MSNIICPVCGTPTAFTPIYLSCERDFNYIDGTQGAAQTNSVVRMEMHNYHQRIKYAILSCQSCDSYFIASGTYSSDWAAVYPISKKLVSEDINEPIRGEFEEACLCFAVGAYRASISMCQIALEALWRDKEVSSLKELYEKGTISKHLFEQADEVRRWGNIAKHEPIPDVVEKDDAEQLHAYLEAILDHVYVQTARLAALKQKRQGLEGQT